MNRKLQTLSAIIILASLMCSCTKEYRSIKNTSQLDMLVQEAQLLADTSQEGADPGFFPIGSTSQLKNMIDSVKTLAQNAETQFGVDRAALIIQGAVSNFKNSIQVEKQLYFDGAGYLDGGIATPYITPQFTLETWVYPTEWKNAMYVISTEGAQNGYKLQCPNGKPTFQIGNGTTTTQLVAPDAINLNEWTHIAASYDGAQMKVYINGVMVAQRAIVTTVATNSDNFRIGEGSRFTSRTFKGRIKGVGIWSRVLSDTEVAAQLHNAPAGTEDGLIAYWPFNLSSGTTILDRTGTRSLNVINAQYVDPL